MENIINKRITEIINYFDISGNEFAKRIGIPQTTFSNIINRNSDIKASIIEAICTQFGDISLEWLITGKGEMLKSTYGTTSTTDPAIVCEPSVIYEKRKEVNPIKQTRPRIPFTAAAGTLTSAVEGVTVEQCEQIPQIVAFPDYDFTIIIKGNSMEPKYEGGDEVACKRVDNTSFIQWGKVHVLDTAQGIIIKRVYEDGDKIRCTSYNPEYPDFSVTKDEIYSMSLVVGLLRL